MMRCLLLILAFLVTPTMTSAQTLEIQKDIEKTLRQARMYEDVEIMRRLLSRKLSGLIQSCQQCHRFGSDMGMAGAGDGPMMMAGMGAGAPEGMMPRGSMAARGGISGGRDAAAPQDSLLVDGLYVPGHGVVFQAQAPAMLLMVPTDRPAKPAAQITEWEIIRKQLRGEVVEDPSVPSDGHHQFNLADALLAALAENGKHFRSLGDNEKLTVAITFRPFTRSDPAGDMVGGSSPFGAASEGAGFGGTASGPMVPMGPGQGLPPGLAAPGAVGAGAAAPPPGRGTSKDHELLADYHLKQGRYDEAARSLLKAITLNTDPARSSGLQRKLAIAYLMADQYDRAETGAVAKALDAIKKAMEGKKSEATGQRPVTLPQRLIVSASRQALQQASRENLDELRRQTSIEWLRFNHPVLRGNVEGAP
jgi:tetratricopeptide (TPR) repeat protein